MVSSLAINSPLHLLTDADRNLILTGYTGPNQPALGRELAERLGRRLVIVEDRVEQLAGMRIEEIRETFGQAHLKNIETQALNEILLNRGVVLRVSGDTLGNGNMLERLAETGPVFCLVAQLDAVLSRLHLAMGTRYHDPAERDLELGKLKTAWSARGKSGVIEIDATYLSQSQTLERIITQWRDLTLRRA